MAHLSDIQRYFICTVKSEEDKKSWGYTTFQKQFPKFMENISRRQFDTVVSNFSNKGIVTHVEGSGRPSFGEEVGELVVSKLQNPPGSPRQRHLSHKKLLHDWELLNPVCKIAKLKCFRRVKVQYLNSYHRDKRNSYSAVL